MNPKKKSFRILLITYLILVILSFTVEGVFNIKVPENIKNMQNESIKQYSVFILLLILLFAIICVILVLISYIGLFLFWKPSPYIFALALILRNIVICFYSFGATTGLSAMIILFYATIEGMIITLALFSPTKELFIKLKT